MKIVFRVEGMHCKSCGILLSDVASEVPGVKAASADSAVGIVAVQSDGDAVAEKVKRAIEAQGYKVTGWESTR